MPRAEEPSLATLRAALVEMDDGRPVLLVELEPDVGVGPFVVDPLGSGVSGCDGDQLTGDDL
jgi:hypothetical protein